MKTHLSLHQRIQNADASQQIENVKAVHAYTHARNWPSEEWNNVWDLSDDCSWAHGFGRWRGGYKVYLNSVTEWDVQAFDTYKKLYKKFPDIMGMDPRPLNVSPMHILCNEVIEVADDGRSGRAAYMTPGHIFTYLRTAGTRWPPSCGNAMVPISSVPRTDTGSTCMSTSARISDAATTERATGD